MLKDVSSKLPAPEVGPVETVRGRRCGAPEVTDRLPLVVVWVDRVSEGRGRVGRLGKIDARTERRSAGRQGLNLAIDGCNLLVSSVDKVGRHLVTRQRVAGNALFGQVPIFDLARSKLPLLAIRRGQEAKPPRMVARVAMRSL